MFLAEPPRTPYDFQFTFLGVPVRVTPFFWLVMLVLGYDLSAGIDQELQEESPGLGGLLLMFVAAGFVSILVHEFGHAVVMRRSGTNAYIVLYHFGGLAVPDSVSSFIRPGRFGRPENQIMISFAGPAAQLILAAVIIAVIRLTGHALSFNVGPVDAIVPFSEGKPLPSRALDVMLFFVVLVSVYWALFNLLPVYPLDGGQISRELFTIFTGAGGFRYCLIVSLITAGAVAVYFYGQGNLFAALLLISFAVSNYQLLQATQFGGGGW